MNKPGKETIERSTEQRRSEITRPSLADARALVVAWSRSEPNRIGEVLLIPARESVVIGRYDTDDPEVAESILRPVLQRPGHNESTAPLGFPLHVSRRQLDVVRRGANLIAIRRGKASVTVNGSREIGVGEEASLQEGDTVRVSDDLLLRVSARPQTLAPLRFYPADAIPRFGASDAFGLVGESPLAWQLRDRIAFVAAMDQHVLASGPSGSGKELVALAIHGLSSRRARPIIAHSMAEIPESLVEAELFGNRKDYPNPGTPARNGLLGEADGTTLFLDEIGAVPTSIQAKLLRVLDDHGSFRRLGEDNALRSDFRLIAATNAEPSSLKFDLLARLKLTVDVPPLGDRLDDVPLLVRHLLAHAITPTSGSRARPTLEGVLTTTFEFAEALLHHDYRANVRELETLLLAGIYGSTGEQIGLTPEVRSKLLVAREAVTSDPELISRAQIEAALGANDWNISQTAKSLGLSRDQLNRKMRKCGLQGPRATGKPE